MLPLKLIHECQVLAHSGKHAFSELTQEEEIRLGKSVLRDNSLSHLYHDELIRAAVRKVNLKAFRKPLNGIYIGITQIFKPFINDELKALA